jgi:hypothetical protein
MTLDELRGIFRKHLYMPDPAILDFTVAVAVANRLGGDPVWAFVVAPPSSGKTEVVQALTGLDETHALSKLTPATLLSGSKDVNGRSSSLLLRLPENALLVLKDFGTVLSMREESRAEILGQLREVYDGSMVAEFGTGRTIRWTGRVGFIAGVTPAIDAHHLVIATLGERFLYLRVPDANRKIVAGTARARKDVNEMRDELRAAVSEYVGGLEYAVPEMPAEVGIRLDNVADIVTWARSAVQRDRYTRDIEVAPSKEGLARFLMQLVSLWEALTVMGHENPIGIVCRVALDSMPPARAAVLATLAAGDASTNDLRDVSRLSKSANLRLLEDLEALDLIHIVTRGGPGLANIWGLTPDGRTTWNEGFGQVGPVPLTPSPVEEGKIYRRGGIAGSVPENDWALMWAEIEGQDAPV